MADLREEIAVKPCGDGMCWAPPLCDVVDDLKAERDRYRELLAWALGWIDHTREAPLSDDDERDGEQDRTMYERARRALEGPADA